MSADPSPQVEKFEDTTAFEDTPEGNAQRIGKEIEAAQQSMKDYHLQCKKIVAEFLDTDAGNKRDTEQRDDMEKWNLFWSDTTTKENVLFARTPKTDVSRRFNDARDQVGRVAAELWERQLNGDVDAPDNDFTFALLCTTKDLLLVDLGLERFRYCAEFASDEGREAIVETDAETGTPVERAQAVPDRERIVREWIETLYVHWRDALWSPCRIWTDKRWMAFASYMSREEIIDNFAEALGLDEETGEVDIELGRQRCMEVPLNATDKGEAEDSQDSQSQKHDVWGRARVWEFWDGERRKVYHYVKGYGRVLKEQDDPYQLRGFYPCQRPMLLNWTTSDFIPRPTYVLVQDLYRSINDLATREKHIADALRVKGVYDSSNEELARLISEANDGQMLPVKNWAMTQEKGGVEGSFALFPIKQVAETLIHLREQKDAKIEAVRQLTGISDFMRGQVNENGTPGEAPLEAKFGSVRMHALKNEIARFASEGQEIRKELIANLFQPQSILEQTNARYTFDADQMPLVLRAIQLMKDRAHEYRVVVKPESIALEDFAAAKSEAFELLEAMGTFLEKAAGFTQNAPQLGPDVLELFEWAMSRVKGGKEIEGIVQRMGQKLAQLAAAAAQQPPQNPAAQEAQKIQLQSQAKTREMQLKDQLDAARQQRETAADVQRDQAEAAQHERQEQVAHALSMEEEEKRAELKIETARAIQAMKPPPRPPGAKP